ncbi:hypothetical protein FLM52_13300 [bacterium Scap17]|nr:hypothetical protein [bacterium Scap17]
MTQTAARQPLTPDTTQLASDLHQLEARLLKTDPKQKPELYRSLYCTISLRQMQLLAKVSQPGASQTH